jgi:hypothetical protein
MPKEGLYYFPRDNTVAIAPTTDMVNLPSVNPDFYKQGTEVKINIDGEVWTALVVLLHKRRTILQVRVTYQPYFHFLTEMFLGGDNFLFYSMLSLSLGLTHM